MAELLFQNTIKQPSLCQVMFRVLFELGCAFGSFVSAKLIDKFKKHKITLCAIIALSIICASGLVLGFQYKKILFSYVSNTFFGILVCAAAVPIFDMLLQHTYPTNPAFVMLIFVGVYKFASVVLGEICRLLLNYFHDVAVFIFMIMLLLMGFCVHFSILHVHFCNQNMKGTQHQRYDVAQKKTLRC